MVGLLLKNSFRQAKNVMSKLNSGQRVVATLFLLLAAGLVLFIFSLFYFVFHYLQKSTAGLGAVVYLLSQLFFLIFILGTFSSTLASLSSFWQNREVKWLFTLPLAVKDVFRYLLIKQVLFNSWPLLLIGWPITLSYVLALKIKIAVGVLLFLILIPLLLIAEALGTALALFLGFFYRQLRSKWFLLLILALALLFAFNLANLITPLDLEKIVSQSVGRYNVSFLKVKVNQPFLPSFWTAQLFKQAVASLNLTSFYFALALTLTAFAFLMLVNLAGSRLYLPAWQQAYEYTSRPLKVKKSKLTWFTSAKGTLIERDLRLFSRNTDEVYQAVFIFLVVLLFLFVVSKLPYLDIQQPLWRYRLALLSVDTICYFLAMLANRFVFPALSLEGRSFWLLLTAPFSLKQFYLSKLFAALTVIFFFATALFCLAAYYFALPLGLAALFYVVVLSAAFVIVVLNLSLGSLYPDFKRQSAAEISSSIPALLAAVFSVLYGALSMLALRPVTRFFFLGQTVSYVSLILFIAFSLIISLYLIRQSLKKLAYFSL